MRVKFYGWKKQKWFLYFHKYILITFQEKIEFNLNILARRSSKSSTEIHHNLDSNNFSKSDWLE